MPQLNNDGPLTVDSAANVFEGLLSRAEDTQDRETHEEPEERDEREDSASEPEEHQGDEPEAPAEESEEPEGEAEPAAPEPRKFRVKVDGADTEVTEEELLAGYSRHQDYTRKTQALADQRKAQEGELAAVRDERAKYAQYLTQLEAAIKDNTPTEPDWDRMRVERPEEFAPTWAAWQQHKQKQQQLGQEAERARDAVLKDQHSRFQQMLSDEQQKLVVAIPAWKDQAVAKKETAELAAFAKNTLGYTDQELSSVYDHRVMLTLRKAMLFDRAQATKAAAQKKIEKGKAAAVPGSTAKRPPTTDLTRSKQRLAKTGRQSDAQAVFEQMLDDDAF